MKPPKAAAIYARISSDQDGTTLGVSRQLADCRDLAQRVGWTIADEYIDNDYSACTGKHRPAYQRMIADIVAGTRDGLIVYHLDRLTRRQSSSNSSWRPPTPATSVTSASWPATTTSPTATDSWQPA